MMMSFKIRRESWDRERERCGGYREESGRERTKGEEVDRAAFSLCIPFQFTNKTLQVSFELLQKKNKLITIHFSNLNLISTIFGMCSIL